MGITGTEVAKEAADMVLTDDNFSTIEAAVEEGRGVFDNLIKFLIWILPTNAGQGLVIIAAVLAGRILPVLPVQALWINMTTAVLLGLTLAFEPASPTSCSAGRVSQRCRARSQAQDSSTNCRCCSILRLYSHHRQQLPGCAGSRRPSEPCY